MACVIPPQPCVCSKVNDDAIQGPYLERSRLERHENLMKQARLVSQGRHTTLNTAFRGRLEQCAAQSGGGAAVDALRRRLRHVRSSGPDTRDEMNERAILPRHQHFRPRLRSRCAGQSKESGLTDSPSNRYRGRNRQPPGRAGIFQCRAAAVGTTDGRGRRRTISDHGFPPSAGGTLIAGDLVDALRISAEHRLAWYDSLIVAAALDRQGDVFYRRRPPAPAAS